MCEALNTMTIFLVLKLGIYYPKKCKEMILDFRKNKTVIPTTKVNGCPSKE